MRDPFDTGPVLRLGEVKAAAPEPEDTKTGYGPGELTKQQKAGLDQAWKAFGIAEIFSQAMKLRDKRPYTFDDVSLSIGGMKLTPVTDEEIKIAVDDRIDLFTAAFAPRIDHGNTSPEALRANHAALVAKEGRSDIIPPPAGHRYVVRDGRVDIDPPLKFKDGDES